MHAGAGTPIASEGVEQESTFIISTVEGGLNGGRRYIFRAPSPKECDAWVVSINTASNTLMRVRRDEARLHLGQQLQRAARWLTSQVRCLFWSWGPVTLPELSFPFHEHSPPFTAAGATHSLHPTCSFLFFSPPPHLILLFSAISSHYRKFRSRCLLGYGGCNESEGRGGGGWEKQRQRLYL